MYQMKKCVKCSSEKIIKGSLQGPATLALNGIPDWLEDYVTYTCEQCGYTEIVKNLDKIAEKKKKQFSPR